MVSKWKDQLYTIYQNQVCNEMQAGMATPTSQWAMKTSGVLQSMEFPNLKVISHCAEQIAFLRPPWLLSMALWERKHQDCKQMIKKTNMWHLDKSVLINMCICCLQSLFVQS
jgi:hypothetical protein